MGWAITLLIIGVIVVAVVLAVNQKSFKGKRAFGNTRSISPPTRHMSKSKWRSGTIALTGAPLRSGLITTARSPSFFNQAAHGQPLLIVWSRKATKTIFGSILSIGKQGVAFPTA